MSTKFTLSAWLLPLTLGSISLLVNLIWTTVARGQSAASSASAIQNSPIAQPTDRGSVLQLDQLEKPSTRAADLLPPCNNDLSEVSDTKVKSPCQEHTEQIAQTDSSTEKENEGSGILEPTEDRFLINAGSRDPFSFNFGLGSLIGEPTVLRGGTRLLPSEAVEQNVTIFPVGGYFEKGFGPNQRTLFEFIGDAQAATFDLSHTIVPQSIPGALSFNVQTRRSFNGAFTGKRENEVNLPTGADPWVHRSGGGVEYVFPVSSKLKLAGGFNYQLVSVRPGAFTDTVSPVDEDGNQVTVSDDGQDTLTTFNLAALLLAVDEPGFTTKGTQIAVGIDASIPTGDADISYGRFTGNIAQFIPLNIFGFTEGPRTLILNLQGGTFAGDDVPPYDAFTLGGNNTVRGYRGGDVGTGKSFFLVSTEYRFPVANNLRILVDFDLQGSLFFDYGHLLNTEGQVIGEPSNARDKPGYGYGGGFGLQLKTEFGLVRAEFAWSENDDFVANFLVGDRY